MAHHIYHLYMIHTHRAPVRAILPVLCLLFVADAVNAAPRVAASIAPVHSLAAGVMAGIGTPDLLVAGGASPHIYALRPSQARLLQRADLVFWVGEELESFLVRPLARKHVGRRVVALSRVAGVRLRDASGRDGHPETGDAAKDKAHGEAHRDMHIWLDPVNAAAMTDAIATALSHVDPANAARYGANAGKLRTRLAALDARLERMLAPIRGVPFTVYHDAYGYFTARYDLNLLSIVAATPEHRPGVARLRGLRRLIETRGVRCVFVEPQFEPAIVRALVRGTAARIATLDPLGAAVPPGPDAYFTMMEALGGALAGCLAANG